MEEVKTETKKKTTKKAASSEEKVTKTTKTRTTKKAASSEEKVTKPETSKKPATKKAPAKKVAKKEVAKEEKVEKTADVKETKEAKTSKKDKKVVETPKVLRTEASAKALNVKVTPRKARLVIDLVRGKDVDVALDILNNTHRKASDAVGKVIKSAYANAVNNFNMNGDKLYVASIMASDSIKMKRYLPRAKGSASGLVKRFANIYVTVKERN